ncbi:MAG TPA: succinate--CoA ligase subunit alpha [Candidatus Dormibacteraeota bacterium]|nr:succinate--CoA ligase subunit alpha [Candidatus Dormibacteraeota bacterium]
MSILVDRGTRLLVQGMTGSEGTFHTEQMIAYGTTVVAGVSPGKGGTTHLGRPVFDTVQDAVAATGANTAAVFVPPPAAADAIMEAGAAGIGLVVAITEGVPILDAIRARAFLERRGVRLIGPNCPGLVSPGDQAKVGIIPNHICSPGPVGIVSRSGTLTYEIIQGLGRAGLGQSSSVGIGGDPVLGLSFAEVVALFAADPQTECVVLAGEIGGSDEERAAEVIAQGYPKPVVAFISGRTAPPGKRMGHAGAIISGTTGTPASKVSALTAAGAVVADTIEEVVELVAARLRPAAAAGA